MPLRVPQLDDLDFDALFEEARGLIPRYAPDWTDHNLHDPGIMLLDLIAWLVDQEIYQVGFVSDRHIEAFAALLGVRRQHATPARGLLWPLEGVVSDAYGALGMDLDKGSAAHCVEQPDLAFQTDADVRITPARIRDALAADAPGTYRVTRTAKTRRTGMRLHEADTIELLLDRPLVQEEGTRGKHPISLGIELDRSIHFDGIPPSLLGTLLVDYRIDADAEPWHRAVITYDGTHALHNTGVVLVRIPPFSADSEQTPKSQLRIYTQRRFHPFPPRVRRVVLNVLPIVQFETVPATVIGTSKGHPNESFELDVAGLAGRKVAIEVGEGITLVEWTRTSDLEQHGPDDRVFVLDVRENRIVFGNGVNGRIPPKGAQIQHGALRRTIGDDGNLAAGRTWTVTGVELNKLQSSFGTNPVLLSGGNDPWDIDRLRAEARRAAFERRALLSNEGLRDAAVEIDGVRDASVRVGFNPLLPSRKRRMRGARTIIVTPERALETDPLRPVPHRFVSVVHAVLQSRRPLGERLSVLATTRVAVSVEAVLIIADGQNLRAVESAALKRLDARLSDVQVQPDVEPWPIGRTVTRMEIQALLATVPGVLAVPTCRLASGDEEPKDDDVDLRVFEVAIGRDHRISAKTVPETIG